MALKAYGMRFLSACLLLTCTCVMATRAQAQRYESNRSLGSAYLPLDHWAYPVIERAIAKGVIPAQFLGLRPWTRLSIADLLEDRLRYPDKYAQDEESQEIARVLDKEFAPELKIIAGDSVDDTQITSLYTRFTGISGDPLRDSYHLGQTLVNDNGRPYGAGFNNITGGSASADRGMFTAYLSGEFEHSAQGQVYSTGLQSQLNAIDNTKYFVGPHLNEVNHGTFQDTYVGATWHGWDVTAGKESMWWGTSMDSSLTLTNNAEPMLMGRIDRVVPFRFPWIFKYLGDVRADFFMGRLEAHIDPAGPWLHGEKISLMPTKNLEIGFARTTIWLGDGRPFSFHRLFTTYFSVGDRPKSSNSAGIDPGDRRGELDVRYRVPGIRNYLTVYFDSLVDDDPSPLAAPHRAAFHPGLFLTKVPGIPRLDLRAEAAYTELPTFNRTGHFFYYNSVYHDGYLNSGMLLGDWVGREGIGGQVTARYWLTPADSFQVSYKHNGVAADFIPGGGYQQDVQGQLQTHLKGNLFLTAMMQYEQYRFPILAPGAKSDFATSVGFTFYPGQRTHVPDK